jgi:hypothetical protein
MISQRGGNTAGLGNTQTSERSPQPTVAAVTAPIAVAPGVDRSTRATDPAGVAPQPWARSPRLQSLTRWPRRPAISGAGQTPNPGT